MSDFGALEKLVELLNPPKDNSDDDEEEDEKNLKEITQNPYKKIVNPTKKVDEKEFLVDGGDFYPTNSNKDWKKSPIYDISYRQKVTPEDMFLGVNCKNPSTASCEDMLINIKLPGEKYQNIDLKIQQKNIELTSPKYYINLPLPQPVNPQKGNAKWNKEGEYLLITLTMDREFDFINF